MKSTATFGSLFDNAAKTQNPSITPTAGSNRPPIFSASDTIWLLLIKSKIVILLPFYIQSSSFQQVSLLHYR